MEFDDKQLADIIATQRNNAMSESAMAQAVIRKLQEKIAEKDARIAELEKPKKKGK